MTDKRLKIIVACAFLVLFGSAFYLYLLNSLFDYDFWWHIATGRHIVTHGRLPEADPFSYTSTMEENVNPFPEREKFFLKQYWLAQVIFFLVFDEFGPAGVIFVRSLLLFLIVMFSFWRLQRAGTKPYINYIFTFLLFLASLGAIGERPVLFSMLFSALTIFLLEDFREKKGRSIFLLIPIMLVWANMHGAFVIGVIIIASYPAAEVLRIVMKKNSLVSRDRTVFFSAVCLAILVTYLNPTGWEAFPMSLHPKYEIFQKGIQEYESIYSVYVNRLRSPEYTYVAFGVLFFLILLIRNRRLDLAHLILLSGFFVMSLKAIRFTFFFAIPAAMILGKEVSGLLYRFMDRRLAPAALNKIEWGLGIAMLVSSLLFLSGVVLSGKPRLDIARHFSVPEKAVDFIEQNHLQGRMFNDYAYGGYMAWRLYPKKTFIDSRTLNLTVMNEYGWVAQAATRVNGIRTANPERPLWEAILRHYKINYVFLPLVDIYGTVYPVVLELTARNEWVPVYLDWLGIIFVKDAPVNEAVLSKYRIDSQTVYNALIKKSATSTIADKINPRHFLSLGIIFQRMGRHEDALKAFRYALERWDLPELRELIAASDNAMRNDKTKQEDTDRGKSKPEDSR